MVPCRDSNFFEAVIHATQVSPGRVIAYMTAWLTTADDVLRRAPWVAGRTDSRRALLRLISCIILFGFLYGAAMGCFRVLDAQSGWILQIAYSAAKVPMLLAVTFTISLPSFFVVNSLLGFAATSPRQCARSSRHRQGWQLYWHRSHH